MNRVLYLLLGLVAVAAAVLSFAALRDLAEACGFAPELAWLLPVVIDAGAAAGSVVWLGARVPDGARRFARALALLLLAASVAANALGHGLAAYRLQPAWWVVVLVSAVAPAVLGAVVHLAVLASRAGAAPAHDGAPPDQGERVDEHDPVPADVEPDSPDVADLRDEAEAPDWWEHADPVPALPVEQPPAAAEPDDDRAARLIADGAGRRRLARELDITEHAARELIAAHRDVDTVGATR
ncbi:DUF2637 domain-containing protein [Pseudonocardia sp. UM4_GMWB1]|uniref:DUF2637 domain-containing protein n=1 Tax=Pseudonocardia sp. UM4_GMWB1 TaxID=2212989 RepID=UPI00307F953F